MPTTGPFIPDPHSKKTIGQFLLPSAVPWVFEHREDSSNCAISLCTASQKEGASAEIYAFTVEMALPAFLVMCVAPAI